MLRLIPDDAMELAPADGSPSIRQLFIHIHYVRLIFVLEDAPEFARPMLKDEWKLERDRDRLAAMLAESAKAVREPLLWLGRGFISAAQLQRRSASR